MDEHNDDSFNGFTLFIILVIGFVLGIYFMAFMALPGFFPYLVFIINPFGH